MIKWYSSKTLWFNIGMTVLLSAPVIATAYKVLVPEQAVLIDSVLGLITGLGNVLLKVWFPDAPIDTPKARAILAKRSRSGEW